MTDRPIVVGVDGTDGALRAVSWGAEEAARRRAPLTLVHGFGIPDAFYGEFVLPADWLEAKQQQSQDWLAEAETLVERAHVDVPVTTKSSVDAPIPLLIEESSSAAMVVLGSSGRSQLGEVVLGSIAVPLAAHGHCPVAVVRGRDGRRNRGDEPVVVGVDGSALSDAAIALAFAEASLRNVSLIAVRAYHKHERILDSDYAAVAACQEKYPEVNVQRASARDDPRARLLAWSREAQLVVVGSRGRGGFAGLLLGSTSHAMLFHAECPVLIARA